MEIPAVVAAAWCQFGARDRHGHGFEGMGFCGWRNEISAEEGQTPKIS